jgi:WD40 repeat protein/serine/threonine protein kinase
MTMNEKFAEIRDHFLAALERDGLDAQLQYAAESCADSPDLRSELDDMLRAHHQQGGFLASRGDATQSVQPLTESAGTQIGLYKLLQQVGEGGMGVVYMAEQTEPIKRRVAVKIIKPGMDSRQVIARFEAERQALSLMDHPNIAKVLDAGTTASGRPYFVMELVKGQPITQYCDEHHLTPRQRLELLLPVCQAIQHAHQKGIIHRDIKPTNILVAEYDQQPVPKVIDFGVAKATSQPLTEKTMFTGFGEIVGTLEYMSPEQAKLNQLDIDTRSDIYSLGVVLYELLTGSTPFDRSRLCTVAFDETLRIIREEEPPIPSTRLSSSDRLATIAATRNVEPARLTKLVRGELDWIVMKCLEKDRNQRYESASAFAGDVQRNLLDEPVQACPHSILYRLRKLGRRHRGALLSLSAVAVAALLAVAALAVSTGLVWRANQELGTEVYVQRITVAHRELSSDNLAAALRALRECPENLRGWEWHYLMRLCKFEPLILRDSTEVYGVAISPNGEQIASVGKDRKIKIWDSRKTKKPLLEISAAHDKAACSVVYHPDGRHVATAGADNLVKVWDLETRQVVFQGPCDANRTFGAAYTVAFSPPNGRLLAAGCDGDVRIWDWKTDRPKDPEHTLRGPEHDSIPVAFNRDGTCLVTGGPWEQGLNLWDVETGQLRRSLPADRHPVTALAFSTDGVRLAAASLGRNATLWHATTGKLLHTLPHTGNVLGVTFSSDAQRLASCGEDKTVHIWDAVTGREVLGLYGHTDMCGCVAFSPDGWRLASASHDGTIRVWDATPLEGHEGQESLTFTQHDHEVRCLAVSPGGERIVSGGNGTLVKVWDVSTGRVSFSFPGHSAPVFSAAWHPDGRRIATAGSAGRQNTVMVWDASNGRVHYEIPVGRNSSSGPYQVVAFSPDSEGRYLVTGKLDGAVEVWDGRTGQVIGTLGTHDREIRGLVFSRNGQSLASASGDGMVKLWDATRLDETQEARHTFRARVPGPSVNVAFSPDGQRLSTGGEGNTVKIWDVEKGGEPLMTLLGHTKDVYAVAFSPNNDGRWIASGGEDSRVKIWDSRTGELVHSFRGHTGLISSLAFSPDGEQLYSGSRDTTVKVWDLTQMVTTDW